MTEVPEGSHAGFRIVDPLLPGLRYVPGSAKVALVSTKDGVAAACAVGAVFGSSTNGSAAAVSLAPSGSVTVSLARNSPACWWAPRRGR